jgi:hypothetical protein
MAKMSPEEKAKHNAMMASMRNSGKYLESRKRIHNTKYTVTPNNTGILDKDFEKQLKRQNEIDKHVEETVKSANPKSVSEAKDIEYVVRKRDAKNELKKLFENEKGMIPIHDFVANKKVLYMPDDVNIEKLSNHHLAMVAPSPHGNHHKNYRIIGNKSPDGTPVTDFVKIIQSDRNGMGYEPENSLTTGLRKKTPLMGYT